MSENELRTEHIRIAANVTTVAEIRYPVARYSIAHPTSGWIPFRQGDLQIP